MRRGLAPLHQVLSVEKRCRLQAIFAEAGEEVEKSAIENSPEPC
jgi:hypothetical protein